MKFWPWSGFPPSVKVPCSSFLSLALRRAITAAFSQIYPFLPSLQRWIHLEGQLRTISRTIYGRVPINRSAGLINHNAAGRLI